MHEMTLPDYLRRAAMSYPGLGISYVQDDGTVDIQTYKELLNEASGLTGGLASLGLKAGDKAIIATGNNRQTITLLWASFLAGIVPTILQPPVTFSDYNPASLKLLNIFKQLGDPLVFTSERKQVSDPHLKGRAIHYSDIPLLENPVLAELKPTDLAFIQFSSGSTGDPKGIMLTHRNIAVNIDAISEGLALHGGDHGGNWMPLYHDMGLIGYHLTPLVCPCQQSHVETIDFIKNPGLWLDMIDNFKITVTGCPNFGQALVVRYLKRKADNRKWDLSTVKALLNGAEPISLKVVDEFMRMMMKHGFDSRAMMPVYGMAEATLAVSFSQLMNQPVINAFDPDLLDGNNMAVLAPAGKPARTIISVGKAISNVKIRIVDENGQPVERSSIGHIQVKGDSITNGYFNRADETALTFDTGWLRTGDMGFIYEENLYITGRFKDIIFMNGRNFYAHDLENLACSLEEISYGKIIFGGITDPKTGKEKILCFIAGIPETQALDMVHKLRTLLRKNLGIHLDEMILIRSNEIPKTSSGKIQRYQLIQQYLQGGFRDKRYK